MIVGTAGHIDHGKTALVKALTGIDADRLDEEKRRGITIDLGFAYQPIEGGEILGFIDVPGHERFVHTMLAGVSGIDVVMLVVAADDGVMPQTREHLQIIDLLGLTRGVVALTKRDLVDADRLADVTADIKRLIAGTSIAGAEILPVSSVTGDGVPDLALWLQLAAAEPRRAARGRFRLAVDRSFTIAGAGTVITGTVFSGSVRAGDSVLVSPSGLEARIRGLRAQNREAEAGRAGERVALNLAGQRIDKEAIQRGDWILDPAAHKPTDRIDVHLKLLKSEAKPIRHWLPAHVHLASAHINGRVALIEGDTLAPGEEALAQLVLDRPIGALSGDRFVLRDQSAQRTLGGGYILDPFPPTRGRRTPERRAWLAAERTADPAKALSDLLALDPGIVDLDAFRRRRNLSADEAAAVEGAAPMVAAGAWGFAAQRWTGLRQQTLDALKIFHEKNPELPGLQVEKLRQALPVRLAVPAFAAVAEALVRAKAVVLDGVWYRLPGHSVRLQPEDERLWARIRPMLGGQNRFRPPRVRDIGQEIGMAEVKIRTLMKRLSRMGQVVEVAHDHFFRTPVVAEMVRIADQLAKTGADGAFSAAAFRDKVDSGRKVAIQVLEFFDRHGITVRRGDLRKIRADRLNLFGKPETP
ncbi:MAG: selenocysteine-specific translation elongation factor [Alphaproteobacteria bacterium]|nr:selenocysteine-specific translation elongation factor [Alphaproteobacteria bacterium]